MTSIKESAKAYEPPQTKNITDLEKVSVNIDTKQETFDKKDPKEGEEPKFTVETFEVDGEKYRLPTSVKAALKEIMKEKPEMEFFKVTKSGTGFGTTYTVIPL